MQTPITKTNKTASTHLLQRRNKTTYITWKASAHLFCAPCRRIYRGGRRHHADISVVVPIILSCRPRVLPGHKDTWNISTTDIAAVTDTDFVGACTPAQSRIVNDPRRSWTEVWLFLWRGTAESGQGRNQCTNARTPQRVAGSRQQAVWSCLRVLSVRTRKLKTCSSRSPSVY